jgi:hypothetical protein
MLLLRLFHRRNTTDADVEREIHALAAQNLALQFVMLQALHRLSKLNSDNSEAIALAFEDAAGIVGSMAIHFGKAASPEHTVKALLIVEEMRVMVLGNQGKPKHGV